LEPHSLWPVPQPHGTIRSRAKSWPSSSAPIASQQQEALADVPSFNEIANKEGQTAGAIVAHIMLPKHPMPAIPLTPDELSDLAAYILSMRKSG
jgi:hypothetical protein